MAEVVDRWHRARPPAGAAPCAEHSSRTRLLVPSADHGRGKRWLVRYRDAHEKQRAESYARRPDADARANLVGAELIRGTYIDPTAAKVTFKAYAEDWRTTRTHDAPTATRVEYQFRLHAYPVFGHRSLRELANRPTLLQAWISGLTLAPSSALQVIRDVSSVFLAAVDDGLISRNPLQVRSISRPKPDENKALPWTLERVEGVAAALDPRYAVVPYLGVGTGMRQGELFGLAAGDVDFLRREVHVRRQVRLIGNTPVFAPVKNDKSHGVPLSDSLGPLLAEHIRLYPPAVVTLPWRTRDGDPVTHRLLLTRPGGLAMHRSRFNESNWRPALRKAGVEAHRRNGCHVLRHTAASAWLASGVDIAAVASFLGDTVATVYETYAHLMPDAPDRARKAMDLFFTSAPDVHREVSR